MTLVLAFYAWQILSGEIIQGVSGTAPFSGWSFGLFAARLAPLLCITILFFISFFFSKQEERVKTITSAAPVDQKKYMFVRLAACAVCGVVMALFITVIGMVYERLLFQEAELWTMVASALTVFVPAVIFTLGIGFAAGRINQILLFVLMPLMFAFAYGMRALWYKLLFGVSYRAYGSGLYTDWGNDSRAPGVYTDGNSTDDYFNKKREIIKGRKR